MTTGKGWWTLALTGTFLIIAALVTQVIALSWRNWIQLPVRIGYGNKTEILQVGLWGACTYKEGCYAFHGDGNSLPWHLQTGVFMALICICFDALILCLCVVELMYLWQAKRLFPLKQWQLYLALFCGFISLGMAGIMALLIISGSEQDVWRVLRDKMILDGPYCLGGSSRFSVSQAWGFQVLVFLLLCFYIVTAKYQLGRKTTSGRDGASESRSHTIQVAVVWSPGRGGNGAVLQRVPPPAYSPPPPYDAGEETSFIQPDSRNEQQHDLIITADTSYTLLL